MMKMYQRVFVKDSLGKYSATITDIIESADNSGHMYFCKYDNGNTSEWVSEIYVSPLEYKMGDKVTSQYGNGFVYNVVNGIHEVTYSHGTLYHLESELQPDNTPKKKKSIWKRIFA